MKQVHKITMVCISTITIHIHNVYFYSSIQLHYLSSAVGLYFPYDFCLYPGMTPVASYSLRYIPFLLVTIISIVFFTAHRYNTLDS